MLRDEGCTLCPLHETAQTVCIGGDGSLLSKVLFVGEAPGETEDRQGRPFVGKAGRLLRGVLSDFELSGVVRIENVVRCRPPGNRDPLKEELAACRQYLEAVIAAMPALEVIVPLGKPATTWFGIKGQFLKRVAGLPVTWEERTVLPLAHPSYLLRNPAYSDTWESHWLLLKQLLEDRPDPSELIGWKPESWKEILG